MNNVNEMDRINNITDCKETVAAILNCYMENHWNENIILF